jgi:hypothetical protein
MTLIVAPVLDNILVLTVHLSGARSGAGLGSGREPWARRLLGVRGGRALRAAGAVRPCLLRHEVRRSGVPDLLGIRTLLSKEGLAVSGQAAPAMLRSVFFRGAATNVLTPKVASFFLAFLAAVRGPEQGQRDPATADSRADLRAAHPDDLQRHRVLFGECGDWLGTCPRLAAGLRWLTGGVLVGLGLRLALPERR